MKSNTSIGAKEIWTITLPIIFGNLAQSLIAIIDTAFLGRLGDVALGASVMTSIYYFAWATLPWGFAIGIQILIARRFGEDKPERIGVIFQHGVKAMSVLAFVLFSLMYLFTPMILESVIKSPNVLAASKEFMHYRVFGIIFVCFNYLSRYFFIGISKTFIISIVTLVMAIVNIVLDYGMIFGKLGFPEMGMGGAALASSIAEMSGMLTFVIYFFFVFKHKKFQLFSYHKFEMWLVGHLVKLSIPTMLQKLFGISIWFVFFTFVEHMGEQPIAVSGIIRSLFMLLGVAIFAFGSTANTVVSRLMGEAKTQEVFKTLNKIILLSFTIVIPIIALCFIYPDLLLSIYTDDAVLKLASISTLHVLCFGMLFYTPAMVYFEAISGTGNTKHALIIEIFVLAFYFLGIYFLIKVLEVGVDGAWLSETIYGSVLLIFCYAYLKLHNWKKTKI